MLPLPRPRPDDPTVIRVLREYRARMDDMESELMRDMARRWMVIEGGLDADVSALAQEMARRTAAGETITKQMVWRTERYQILKARLADEIKKYNLDYAVGAATNAQRQYATLGINAAQDAITAMYPSPLSAAFNRINVRAVESMIGFAGDGSPLRTLLVKDYPEAVDGLLDALINGLGRGLGPAQIGRNMADGMGMGLDRSLLIARTEAARAYRTASTEQYRQSGVTTGFMRLVKKETACAACLFLDGERFSSEDELDDHPRGKCMVIPLVEGVGAPEWEKGQDWFNKLPPEQQKQLLGEGRYDLWQSGKVRLSDLVDKSYSDIWGDAPRVKTLKDLLPTVFGGKWELEVGRIAERMGFPAEKITYLAEERKFTLGGKKYTYAGSYDPATKEVAIYPSAWGGPEDSLKGIVAHEVQHSRWDTFAARMDKENGLVSRLIRSDETAIYLNGELREEFRGKYPFYEFQNLWVGKDLSAAGAQVSTYAAAYWQESASWGGYIRAFSETLAEVARLDTLGKLNTVPGIWRTIYEEQIKLYSRYLK